MKKRSSEKRKISSERRRGIARSGEKKFFAKARHSSRIRRSVIGWYRRDPYSSFKRLPLHTVIDVLSKYAGRITQEQGWKRDGWCYRWDRASGRCPKNLQTDMGKEFYNADVQTLIIIPRIRRWKRQLSSSIARSKITWNMWKMFYTQRQLQVDGRAAASRVRLQRA